MTGAGLLGGLALTAVLAAGCATVSADRALAAQVERALAGDLALRDAVIEAEAEEGRVTLSGTVPTFRERTRAIEAALRVPGVRSVRSRLVLQAP